MKITLKALRVNRDLTQDEAAKILNVTAKTIQNWESYTTFPTGKQLIEICTAYGCELNDIFLPTALAKSEVTA